MTVLGGEDIKAARANKGERTIAIRPQDQKDETIVSIDLAKLHPAYKIS